MSVKPYRFEWSVDPGSHEAHLKRRFDNPYFPEARRRVTREDLLAAKQADERDFIQAEGSLQAFMARLEANWPTTSRELTDYIQALGELAMTAIGIGGRARAVAQAVTKLRDAAVADLKQAFAGDEQNLRAVLRADEFSKQIAARFSVPVIAQAMREGSPIRHNEFIPTILSEHPDEIRAAMRLLPEKLRKEIKPACVYLMREATAQGYVDPMYDAKLEALGGGSAG